MGCYVAGIMPCGVCGARNPIPTRSLWKGSAPSHCSQQAPALPGAHPCSERVWGTQQELAPGMLTCTLSSTSTARGPVCVRGHQDYR